MTLINCDIGEQGPLHEGDRKLMDFIHIANLACEGHAGDRQSVAAFRALADARGVRLAAHLSYPDRENFGRATMRLPDAELLAALEAQLALLPGVTLVKFHGALYNDAWRDAALAELLAGWLRQSGITEIIAPADSELSFAARKLGITVLREAFADRRYVYDGAAGRLRLADRSAPDAVIAGAGEALAQAEEIIKRGRVNAGTAAAPEWRDIEADTVCIHSDSPIAQELAAALRAALDAAGKENAGAGVKGNIRLAREGVCEIVGLPVYGRQDIGVSPGGAMDCFSLRRGNLMLGNPEGSPALEILAAPEIEVLAAGDFVLTGARHKAAIRRGGNTAQLEHSRVYSAEPGDRLTFSEKSYGLQTYFCFRNRAEGAAGGGAAAVPYAAVSGWADPLGRIRVVPGPEYKYLEKPEQFFENAWRTTYKMDKVGIRLAGEPRLKCSVGNMISGAVADGTVQLTPESPIILLRHRQTTGGYPRIFNVISADIDLLGQYAPNQAIHFAQVTLDQARDFARQKEAALAKLRK